WHGLVATTQSIRRRLVGHRLARHAVLCGSPPPAHPALCHQPHAGPLLPHPRVALHPLLTSPAGRPAVLVLSRRRRLCPDPRTLQRTLRWPARSLNPPSP